MIYELQVKEYQVYLSVLHIVKTICKLN